MNSYIKILLVSIIIPFHICGMSESALDRMHELLEQHPQDAQSIADELWESTYNPTDCREILDLVNTQVPQDMHHAIAQAVLVKGQNIANMLLPNTSISFELNASPNGPNTSCQNFDSFEIANNLRYVLSTRGMRLYCWDIATRNAQPIMTASLSPSRMYKFSKDGKYVLHVAPDAVVRYNLETKSQIRIPFPQMDSISTLEDKFVAIRTNAKLFVFDFDHPEQPLPIPAGCKWLLATSPDNKYLLLLNSENNALLYNVQSGSTTDILGIHRPGQKTYKFSLDSKYFLTGMDTDTITQWNLDDNAAQQIHTYSADPDFTYTEVLVLAHNQILAKQRHPASLSIISIIDLQAGTEKFISDIDSYIIAADKAFIAFAKDNAISVYDVEQKKVKQTIEGNFDKTEYYISPHGTYIALRDASGTQDIMVYATTDNSLLMRFPSDAPLYCFDDMHEQYLIGYCLYDAHDDTQNVEFRNVKTNQYLGRYTLTHTNQATLKFVNSCCKLISKYNPETRAFSFVKIDGIIRLDTELNNLHSIKKALELAIASNEQHMHKHAAELTQHFNSTPHQSFIVLFDILERWQQYCNCTELLHQITEPAQEPLHKKGRTSFAVPQLQSNLLLIKHKQLQDTFSLCQLITSKAQAIRQDIHDFAFFIQRFLTLPDQERRTLLDDGLQEKVVRYYPMVKDKILFVAAGNDLPVYTGCETWRLYALYTYVQLIPCFHTQTILQQIQDRESSKQMQPLARPIPAYYHH